VDDRGSYAKDEPVGELDPRLVLWRLLSGRQDKTGGLLRGGGLVVEGNFYMAIEASSLASSSSSAAVGAAATAMGAAGTRAVGMAAGTAGPLRAVFAGEGHETERQQAGATYG
jgi:hypothetical protein